MINYKKANAYFSKQLKKSEIRVWYPKDGGVWVLDAHIAIFYPRVLLPFDPSALSVATGFEKLLKLFKDSIDVAKVTPFLWDGEGLVLRVLSNRNLIRKEFIDILGVDELLCGSKNMYADSQDVEAILGIVCGYIPENKDLWGCWND